MPPKYREPFEEPERWPRLLGEEEIYRGLVAFWDGWSTGTQW